MAVGGEIWPNMVRWDSRVDVYQQAEDFPPNGTRRDRRLKVRSPHPKSEFTARVVGHCRIPKAGYTYSTDISGGGFFFFSFPFDF